VSTDLSISQVRWRRLRNIILIAVAILAGIGAIMFMTSGGSFVLNADGVVTSERITIAAPYPDARVREVLVQPGEKVEAGQRIAIVESAQMLRTLSELSVEKAKLNTRMAEIGARLAATQKLIPEAEANNRQIKSYLDKLREAHSKGTVIDKTLSDMMNASLQASERLSSLIAERQSLEAEVASYREAVANVGDLYQSLSKTYADGVLTTPVSGYVGSKVMTSGSVASANGGSIATVYTGAPYILAYLPDSYLLNIDAGEGVKVRSYARSVVGTVKDILPVTDAVPPEFQVPTAVRERGRLVKIAIPEATAAFSLDQKVKISACMIGACAPDDPSSTVAGAAYHQNTFAYMALAVLSETTRVVVKIVTTVVGWAVKSA